MSFILDAIKKSEKERRLSKNNEIHSFQNDSNQNLIRKKKGIFFKVISVFIILILFLLFIFSSELKLFAKSFILIDKKNEALLDIKNIESVQSNSLVDEDKSSQNPSYKVTDSVPPNYEIKELWQMPLVFQESIPKLNFELHIFSEDPSERTIIINNRRMREGQLISAGLTLKEITQTGVILHKENIFFHVDVIESW